MAITLSIALIVSLVLALLVSPSWCAAFLKTREGQAEHGRLFEKLVRGYERLLGLALRRPSTLPLAIVLILGATSFFGTHLESGFMPVIDEGAFVLDFQSPPGTTLEESDRLLKSIDAVLQETPEVLSYSRRTGAEMGFAGLVPLALGLGAGAEMQKPLAIAVIGGLSFSTVFTLILAPLLYVALRRWQLARWPQAAP